MVPVLLIGIPLLAGLIGFSLKDAAAKGWALFASLLTLGESGWHSIARRTAKNLLFNAGMAYWLNSHFAMDWMAQARYFVCSQHCHFPLFLFPPGKKNIKRRRIFSV